jgi:hypothetical protein
MKEIPLTQGKVALVDDEDFEWLNQWRWYCNVGGYAVRNLPGRKSEYMHRAVAKTSSGYETDHINHNRLDNQKSNLRICTGQQNHVNKLYKHIPNSGYRGVETRGRKYRAHISIDHKTISLGTFFDPEEAALAYDKAALKYFGEFAITNMEAT